MSNEYPYASMRDSFDLSAYFVVGPEDCKGRPLTDVVDQALHGGATFIQLRAKEADASELTDMARDIAQIIEDNEKSDSVAFVIDDRADVVWQARRKGIKVDGVHIGQTDMEPREARALLGDEAIVGLSAETESLVRLINELPDGCIDYIGAGPLHVSTTKPEASVGGNDGSGKTLDAAQINTICVASEFPVVVGGGVTAADMAMLAGTKAAGWFVVSAIAGAENPEEAARTMVGSSCMNTACMILPAALRCLLACSSEQTLRSRCAMQRCHAAPGKHSAMARRSPSWASLVTHFTPETPRLRRSRQNPSHPA